MGVGQGGMRGGLGSREIKGIEGSTGRVGTLVLGGPICKGVNSDGGTPRAGNHAGVPPHLFCLT